MTEHEIRALFGQNVKLFRKEKNISQMQLAEKTDLTFNFINDIENGKKWVSPATLSKLSEALGVQPYRFFLPIQNEPPPYRNKLLVTFSDDILNQIGRIFRETMERYE